MEVISNIDSESLATVSTGLAWAAGICGILSAMVPIILHHRKAPSWSQVWAAGIFGILAAASGVILYHVESRIGELSSQAQKVELAKNEKLRLESELALSRQLGDAKEKLSELQEKGKDRHLTNSQRNLFIQYLTKAPKGAIGIEVGDIAQETKRFAKEIILLLKDAGFEIKQGTTIDPLGDDEGIPHVSGMVSVEPLSGHIAMIIAKNSSPSFAEPIRKAFHKIGIEVDIVETKKEYLDYFKASQMQIYIGGKQL